MKRYSGCVLGGLLAAALWFGPPARAQATAKTDGERRIASNDLLAITIVGERDLQTDFRVSSGGTIQFPFLEEVEVAGLTPTELRAKLRELLMIDYFVDPQVIVTVKDYRVEFVRVIGQVNRPGPVSLTGEQRLDIFDAIAMAGGTTPRARSAVEYTHGGSTRTLKLDELKRETDPAKKIWVQPGDIIDVKESVL
jgi:polysaccharide biosynthesis/export protein VpsN